MLGALGTAGAVLLRLPHARVEKKLDRFAFEAAVVADAGGWASSEESAAARRRSAGLGGDAAAAHSRDRRRAAAAPSSLTGELRELVLADLSEERARLAAVLLRLTGDEIDAPVLTQPGCRRSPPTGRATGPAGLGVRPVGAPALATAATGAADARLGGQAQATGRRTDRSSARRCCRPPGPRVGSWCGPAARAPTPRPDDSSELLEAGRRRRHRLGAPSAGAHPRPARRRGPLGADLPDPGLAGRRRRRPRRRPASAPACAGLGEIALWGTELVAQGRMVPVVQGRQLRQLQRAAGRRTPPGALGAGPGGPGSAARPGDPDADLGGGPAARRPGRCRVPVGAGRRGRRHLQGRRRPAGRPGRRAARQHPHRDRRGGAVGPRRPPLYGRLRAGRAGRRGPQTVGRSGHRPTTASA